jgi:hypothetical protein
MVCIQLFQQFFAGGRQFHQHLTAILLAWLADSGAPLYQPVNQFHRAVVSQAETIRQSAHRWNSVCRQTLNGEHQLMLLGLKAIGPRDLLTVLQIAANTKTDFG